MAIGGGGAFDPRQVLSGQSVGQTRRRYSAGQKIYQQGDPADLLFYIAHGHVSISVVSPTGREAIIGLRGPDDFFGVRSLMANSQRLSSATAMTGCTIIEITKSAMAGLLREHLGLTELFISYLLRQHLRDQGRIINLLTYPAEGRLARTLLQLAEGSPTGSREIQLDQTTLANLVGATRGRVNFFMTKFKRAGPIEYDRRRLGTNSRSRLRSVCWIPQVR